jgi:HPt (histidine-containing phosphotransfer) domain-containing protein
VGTIGPAARARKIREIVALARRVRSGVNVGSDETAGAVDFAYLEAFAAGDKQVVAEVLALFLQQCEGWVVALRASDPGWRDVVHTIKGAARGVGANQLADACERAEERGEIGLPAARQALGEAMAAVAAYQARGR